MDNSMFDRFRMIIFSNEQISKQIHSLHLSNANASWQIQPFLSRLSSAQLTNLQSLTLIEMTENNLELIKSVLPFLSRLISFHYTGYDKQIDEILFLLPMTELRVLTIPELPEDVKVITKLSSITHLTVSSVNLGKLIPILAQASQLRHLKAERWDDDIYIREESSDQSSVRNVAMRLEQLTIEFHYSTDGFFGGIFQQTPNLTTLKIDMFYSDNPIRAFQWEELIESHLPCLHTFKFNFSYNGSTEFWPVQMWFEEFQDDFWIEEHHWYTEYSIGDDSAMIYTIPYISERLQLFKDVILHLPEDDEEAKEEMIDVCRQYYRNNRQFLKQIDEFQEDYHQDASIDWYTKDGFIYRLINTALRTENIEQLYRFRYYIADLSKQLRVEYQKFKLGDENIIVLHRGTIMTRNEAEQLQANKGQLIAVNTYWSTSRNKTVAHMFIHNQQNDADLVAVLFQIECNTQDEHNSVIFADIAGYSEIPDEDEVLFDIGAVFRIENITQGTIDTPDVLVVQMKTTNEGQDVLEEYRNQNREEMNVESPTIMLCTILKRMGKFDQSHQLLQRLLDHPNGQNLIHIHNRLGITYKDERRYDLALEHFEQALQLIDSSDPSQRKYAAFIHHNKGLLYARREQLDKALEFYEYAIEMLKKEISTPDTGIAQFLSSIGRIYFHQRKYQKALQYQQDALQMREECLPANHLVLAFSYADIGNIYRRQRDYGQALHYHKKALALRQRYLPANHHNTAYSLHEVGKFYFKMDYIPSLLEDIAKTFDVDASKDAFADSLRYRLEALELQWQVEPVDYSRLIYRLDQLVSTYEQLNNVDDSLKYAKQALEIQRSIQPDNYLAVSQRLDHLGFMCKLMRNLNDALMYYEEALNIRARHLPDERWYLACSWKNVATVYEQMRDHRRALDSYKRAWTEYHVNYQHKHSFCHEMSRNIARVKRYL
ncbi:unnamed protein product [Adineta steineri]|uniref:Tetratricopeptide repeat protein n=1 Tax=Adineta steineri TaxID=433720 RepID=A0A818IMR4_9BILA|nr:unnamed protein product [Adineta steineri]